MNRVMFPARVSQKVSFICHNTVSYYSSKGTANYKNWSWEKFYKNFTGFSKLEKSANDALFVENSYLSNKKDSSQCWETLHNSQKNLETLHCKLDPLPVHDGNYANLIKDEAAMVNGIRSLSLDFNLYNRATQDSIRSFTSTAEDCFNQQTNCEKRLVRLKGLMILSGLAVGSLFTFILSNIEYASKDKIDESYGDVSDILAWIQTQNSKLRRFTKDLWIILGSSYEFLVDEDYIGDRVVTSLDNPLLEVDVTDVILQNELMLKEMHSIESAISNLKELKKLPELVLVTNKNDRIENRGLWVTTLTYGATAVLLPITLLFL